MKYKTRPINVFQKNVIINNEEILNLPYVHKNKLYTYEDSLTFKDEELVVVPTNIFQRQNKNIHILYKNIIELLDDACNHYQINKSKQFYYLTGKIIKYENFTNNEIFDFPGRDIPVFHGFYVLSNSEVKQKYYALTKEKEYVLNSGDLTLCSPTNLINTKVQDSAYILEYYISPVSFILQNQEGVWTPVHVV